MHLTDPVLFSHRFHSGTGPGKEGLQLLGPRLTPGRAQLKKVLSNTERVELELFVSDANVHRRLLQGWAQFSARRVSTDSGVTGATVW